MRTSPWTLSWNLDSNWYESHPSMDLQSPITEHLVGNLVFTSILRLPNIDSVQSVFSILELKIPEMFTNFYMNQKSSVERILPSDVFSGLKSCRKLSSKLCVYRPDQFNYYTYKFDLKEDCIETCLCLVYEGGKKFNRKNSPSIAESACLHIGCHM